MLTNRGPLCGCPVLHKLEPFLPPYKNVLPPHPYAATRMNLQGNHAIGEFGCRVRIIHNLYTIETSYDMIAFDRHFEVIPLAGLQCLLSFLRGHYHPAAAATFIKPASMLAGARVHLHLHSFNVRTVLGVDAGNPCV